jgi:hypothetical protein
MQFYRCQCGASEYYGSGEFPKPCEGCDKCGTTFAQRSEDHKPRAPHVWREQFDHDTGKPVRPICSVCYHRGPKPEPEKVATHGEG